FQSEENQLDTSQRTPNQAHNNANLLRYDAVPTEHVRLAVISRRLANLPENSLEKESLEHELAQ
ncbi:unnamed protein product, partial [Rotaria magnacalcarata]